MNVRIERYNEILGIDKRIDLEELKRIYRIKAKQLHPDRNTTPDSHDQFVLLHEAYEFYNKLLNENASQEVDNQIFNSNKYPNYYHTEKWNHRERVEARKKASRRAKMKYAQFERKGYPQLFDKIFYVFDLIRLVAAMFLLIVVPVFLYSVEGINGVLLALLVQAITFPIWTKAITRFL